MSHPRFRLFHMRNQLLLITDEPAGSGTEPAGSGTAKIGADSDGQEVVGHRMAKTSRRAEPSRHADRAHKGAEAARQALHEAAQRADAREQRRREAREAALLAAITQPHLPELFRPPHPPRAGGASGRHAA